MMLQSNPKTVLLTSENISTLLHDFPIGLLQPPAPIEQIILPKASTIPKQTPKTIPKRKIKSSFEQLESLAQYTVAQQTATKREHIPTGNTITPQQKKQHQQPADTSTQEANTSDQEAMDAVITEVSTKRNRNTSASDSDSDDVTMDSACFWVPEWSDTQEEAPNDDYPYPEHKYPTRREVEQVLHLAKELCPDKIPIIHQLIRDATGPPDSKPNSIEIDLYWIEEKVRRWGGLPHTL
jgi:hypothetical protein